MGIEGFHSFIEKDYPEAYHNINTTTQLYHHVYIDLNYILHLCHFNSNDEVHLINKMSLLILDICAKTQPVISLNLYCDGTAPFAKMVIQRERRSINIKESDDIYKTSLNFTPGTKFIKELPKKLNKIIKIIREQFCIEVNVDSIEAGEAEIKIKNKLLELYNKNKTHNHLLVTNDADVVIILCATDTYKKSYILLRDKVLSMDRLIKEHFKIYFSNLAHNISHTSDKSDTINLDFVFLNVFLGNDYIPKISQISAKKLWECYRLNINEHKYLLKITKKDNKNIFDINKQFLIDILNDCIAQIGRNKIIKNNTIYNKHDFDNYFKGILWTIDMYNVGKCNDYSYICENKKPIDILNFVLYLNSLEDINMYIHHMIDPIPSILCGILLLPKDAQELIDEKYQDFMKDDDVKVIYNKDFKITNDYLKKIVNKFNLYEKILIRL